MADLMDGSALDIAARVHAGEVSAGEVFAAARARIDEVNPSLNAVVTLADPPAAQPAANVADLPLAGVPFTVKDVIQTEGLRTTAGSLLLADNIPTVDATVVSRLRAAGAVLVGKANCPEFAMNIHTTNRIFGTTVNPLDPTRTSGGSSGGDSAAVASGCAAFGIGTDYGGSIRWPANCTGLASIRPTAGRVPATGLLPNASPDPAAPPNSMALRGEIHTIAPIARTIRDAWAVLQVIAGPDGHDFRVAPVSLGDPWAVDVSALRCAVVHGEGSVPVRRDLLDVVDSAGATLAGAGAVVDAAPPPGLETAYGIHQALRSADGLLDIKHLAEGRHDLLTESTLDWFSRPGDGLVESFQSIAYRRDALRAQIAAWMQQWPILVLPVASIPAFDVTDGMPDSFDVDGAAIGRYDLMASCWAVSVLGLPAAVVRFGTSAEGLPVGVQVVGRPYADHEVVAVAAALEDAYADANR